MLDSEFENAAFFTSVVGRSTSMGQGSRYTQREAKCESFFYVHC